MLAPMLRCNEANMIQTHLRFLLLVHILSSSSTLKLTLNYPQNPQPLSVLLRECPHTRCQLKRTQKLIFTPYNRPHSFGNITVLPLNSVHILDITISQEFTIQPKTKITHLTNIYLKKKNHL